MADRPDNVKCVDNVRTGLTFCGRTRGPFEFTLTGADHAAALGPSGSWTQCCPECSAQIMKDLALGTYSSGQEQ